MNADGKSKVSIAAMMDEIGRTARRSAVALAGTTIEQRNAALSASAAAIREAARDIVAANDRDLASARSNGLSDAMLDRLMLDDARIEAMSSGLESIETLPDPLSRVLDAWERPNGLKIQRVSVPLGVIGIIYESRPNVT
ncbi:MAG: gamma-glutamyl-phosphate reductase, partial [Woeseiaceae bacterium]